MHRGYYPLVDNQPMNDGQGFRRTRPLQTEPGADGRPPDNRHPMDKALEHLTKTLPLNDAGRGPRGRRRCSRRSSPGSWAITGTAAGQGRRLYGQVTITADPSAPDTLHHETRYTVARTGEDGVRARARRSSTPAISGAAAAPRRAAITPWREVHVRRARLEEMWGRWFTGAYDETGIDVKLVAAEQRAGRVRHERRGAEDRVDGAAPVKIFGANLPASVKTGRHRARPGRQGHAHRQRDGPTSSPIEVDVAATAPIGPRDVSVAGTVKPSALVVYDKIDGIKVLPQAGMARVGGTVFPKQLQQFEAVGINNGPDGKPDTR